MEMPVLAAMRHYVFGFVNSHDFSVCRDLMSDDYRLHMGDTLLTGRDDEYIPAVRHQIDQFADMGMAVHDLITDGRYAVLHFSEHGRGQDGRSAAWPGVSIYRLDAGKLVECWVEQDHYSRRQQISNNAPLPVGPVHRTPFSGHSGCADPGVVSAVYEWLENGRKWPAGNVSVDPGPYSAPTVRLDDLQIEPNVVVAEHDRAGFHAMIWGNYLGGAPEHDHALGQRLPLHVAGIATVHRGTVSSAFAYTNRVAFTRRLQQL